MNEDLETAVDYHRRLAEAVPENQLAKKIRSLVELSEMHELLWQNEQCLEVLEEIRSLGSKMMKPYDRALLLRRMGTVALATTIAWPWRIDWSCSRFVRTA